VDEAKGLNAEFDKTAPNTPERKVAVDKIKANFGKQKKLLDEVKQLGTETRDTRKPEA